jgi:hypothetical protein
MISEAYWGEVARVEMLPRQILMEKVAQQAMNLKPLLWIRTRTTSMTMKRTSWYYLYLGRDFDFEFRTDCKYDFMHERWRWILDTHVLGIEVFSECTSELPVQTNPFKAPPSGDRCHPSSIISSSAKSWLRLGTNQLFSFHDLLNEFRFFHQLPNFYVAGLNTAAFGLRYEREIWVFSEWNKLSHGVWIVLRAQTLQFGW